jgi:hypothetical protein
MAVFSIFLPLWFISSLSFIHFVFKSLIICFPLSSSSFYISLLLFIFSIIFSLLPNFISLPLFLSVLFFSFSFIALLFSFLSVFLLSFASLCPATSILILPSFAMKLWPRPSRFILMSVLSVLQSAAAVTRHCAWFCSYRYFWNSIANWVLQLKVYHAEGCGTSVSKNIILSTSSHWITQRKAILLAQYAPCSLHTYPNGLSYVPTTISVTLL